MKVSEPPQPLTAAGSFADVTKGRRGSGHDYYYYRNFRYHRNFGCGYGCDYGGGGGLVAGDVV